MGLGLVIGFIAGKLAIKALNSINLDSSGLYPIFALAFALLTYGLTAFLHGSGLLAVYVLAIIIGNAEIAYRHSIFRFSEGFAWIMQILMFVILGLLVFPSELFTWDISWRSLLISAILIFIARPIAVYLSTIKMNYTHKEKIFLSWAGLKGSVPIVLATFPMLAHIEGSQLIFNVVFFVVLVSCLIQGATVTNLAEKLKLNGPQKVTPIHALELLSLGKTNKEIVGFEINSDSVLVGKKILDIPFPEGSIINAIIRKDQVVTPMGNTIIHSGDFLYLLTSKQNKPRLKQLLEEKRPKVYQEVNKSS
jgi:cell volume regulation protein A